MLNTILIVHRDIAFLEAMVPHLSERGFHVLGPARTAAMSLAIAAQTPVGLALVGQKLAGVRDGPALARMLRETWGVRTLLLRDRVSKADVTLGVAGRKVPA
jgi:DNA-binding response OmpR family regulator